MSSCKQRDHNSNKKVEIKGTRDHNIAVEGSANPLRK